MHTCGIKERLFGLCLLCLILNPRNFLNEEENKTIFCSNEVMLLTPPNSFRMESDCQKEKHDWKLGISIHTF